MASPPDYDKEPKAPDKRLSNIQHEDFKNTYDPTAASLPESDSKSHNNVANTDVENKHVGTLDDGQLRALLDEAITYKCPKDREGKSSLFKELLEEVEQDEQACEAAARELTGSRGRRAGKGRRALPHSNSLQDLVAALAAEPTPRRRAAPAQVSARAIHGGSLPSGVDTSFLLSEEPTRGGYLATVRCVNPPPLSERRVSIDSSRSDNESRRSKPSSVGVTYTARATLEIGGAGRAVTTTSPSNQAKLMMALQTKNKGGGSEARDLRTEPRGPHRDQRHRRSNKETYNPQDEPIKDIPSTSNSTYNKYTRKITSKCEPIQKPQRDVNIKPNKISKQIINKKTTVDNNSHVMDSSIRNWYKSLENMETDNFSGALRKTIEHKPDPSTSTEQARKPQTNKQTTYYYNSKDSHKIYKVNKPVLSPSTSFSYTSKVPEDYAELLHTSGKSVYDWNKGLKEYSETIAKIKETDKVKLKTINQNKEPKSNSDIIDKATEEKYYNCKESHNDCLEQFKQRNTETDVNELRYNREGYDSASTNKEKKLYRQRVGKLEVPKPWDFNPRNVKKMTIGKPLPKTIILNQISDESKAQNVSELVPCIKQVTGNNDAATNEVKMDSYNNSHNPQQLKPKVHDKVTIEMEALDKKDKKNDCGKDIEMIDMPKMNNNNDSFLKFYAEQQKVINALEESNFEMNIPIEHVDSHVGSKEEEKINVIVEKETVVDIVDDNHEYKTKNMIEETNSIVEIDKEIKSVDYPISSSLELATITKNETIVKNEIENHSNIKRTTLQVTTERKTDEHYILAELSNNAYIFLTLPKRLPTPNQDTETVHEIENNNIKPYAPGEKIKSKKKKVKQCMTNNKETVINKDVLRELLIENLFKNTSATSRSAGLTTIKETEVDSAIPFSCITTPEVVSSCNTTTATAPTVNIIDQKARSTAVTNVNGVTRPHLSSCSPPDDFKKSLDENGNSVQGYGGALSGSGQHKKPRRKKTNKNEIVIKSHQIDGYQGNKDLNEVLRFIESHAARPKLRKHRDDADEKKSRTSRRKDKESGGAPRAASLEEVSRTTLEELTSGGGDLPAVRPADPADADADFTTVTKRRGRRRRELPAAAAAPAAERYAVPDLISSCREYPALPPPPPRRAPDLVADRRAAPAVLLRPRRPRRDDAAARDLTFGFELNETLLAPSAPPPPPPPPHHDQRLLDHIVTYVAHAWEDVIKCGNGKVRYFSE